MKKIILILNFVLLIMLAQKSFAEEMQEITIEDSQQSNEAVENKNNIKNKQKLVEQFSAEELKKMSVFISNFTEVTLFQINPNEEIFYFNAQAQLFGVMHNFFNNNSRIKKCVKDCKDGEFLLSIKHVNESIEKYFDYKLQENDSLPPYFVISGDYYNFGKGIDIFKQMKAQKVFVYARVSGAEKLDDGNIKMVGQLYQSNNTKQIAGSFEALAKTHRWQGKNTYALISIKSDL